MPQVDHRTERYGPFETQAGDLHLPLGPRPAVVCLLHGGFWRVPHGRDQMTAISQDLASKGFAVWNLGYRRLGEPGGGWPGTFDDVVSGIEHLARLVEQGVDLDLDRVVLADHSAGGQLALWAAAHRFAGKNTASRVRIAAVAGQAAVTDLVRAHDLGLGGGAVEALLGGRPLDRPETFASASPLAKLPLGVPQLILHGTADAVVPIEISREYVRAAREAGDRVEFRELSGAGHMDYLDPSSEANAALRAWLTCF